MTNRIKLRGFGNANQEESFTVYFNHYYAVPVTATSAETASEIAERLLSEDSKLYATGIDYSVERN